MGSIEYIDSYLSKNMLFDLWLTYPSVHKKPQRLFISFHLLHPVGSLWEGPHTVIDEGAL